MNNKFISFDQISQNLANIEKLQESVRLLSDELVTIASQISQLNNSNEIDLISKLTEEYDKRVKEISLCKNRILQLLDLPVMQLSPPPLPPTRTNIFYSRENLLLLRQNAIWPFDETFFSSEILKDLLQKQKPDLSQNLNG